MKDQYDKSTAQYICEITTELTKLKADVERLRTSAEPFAKIAKWFGDSLPDTETLVRGTAEYRLTLGHFRALARALEETK